MRLFTGQTPEEGVRSAQGLGVCAFLVEQAYRSPAEGYGAPGRFLQFGRGDTQFPGFFNVGLKARAATAQNYQAEQDKFLGPGVDRPAGLDGPHHRSEGPLSLPHCGGSRVWRKGLRTAIGGMRF